ncbi:MAG TPA: hypothetical protein VKY26_03565 [Actinomycetota bacterium]|nr:hypothetical protein [Actinomycetota bacterium]
MLAFMLIWGGGLLAFLGWITRYNDLARQQRGEEPRHPLTGAAVVEFRQQLRIAPWMRRIGTVSLVAGVLLLIVGLVH